MMFALQRVGTVVDYSISYELAAGDAVSSSVWSVTPNAVSPAEGVLSGAQSAASDPGFWLVSVKLASLQFGKTYELVNVIVTNQGRTESGAITVRCGG